MKQTIWVGMLVAVAAAAGVGANRPDYAKAKTDMELESSQLISKQREVLERIESSADNLVTEGGRALAEFKAHVNRLVPYLAQPTSEPLLDNIQEFINSKTEDRQAIIKTLSDTKMYRDRAEKELKESEKRYNKMLEHLTSSSELEKNIRLAMSHYKSLGLTNERLDEIRDKVAGFGPQVKEKIAKINTGNKKLELYRNILEMAKRTRAIVAESKQAYVDSFNSKDRILDFANRMDSLARRAKLLLGEAKKRGVYKVELDKMGALGEELGRLKEQLEGLVKSTNRSMESMQATLAKGEGYERSIVEEATGNKHALGRAFSRGKELFAKMAKVQAGTQNELAAIDKCKRETAELLQRGNALVNEMEGINRRRSAVGRKSLNISTPQDLRSLAELDYPAELGESDGAELDLGELGSTKRTREQANGDAIGSYLRDLELSGRASPGADKGAKKKKGLIKKGFKFLKKLAVSPESLVESALGPSLSNSHHYDDHHFYDDAGDHSAQNLPAAKKDTDHNSPTPKKETDQNLPATKTEQPIIPADHTDQTATSPLEQTDDYKRAVKESIESRLEREARNELERINRVSPELYSGTDNEIYKLVELAYLLKKQFELVRADLQRSLTMNTLDIFKDALKSLLHQHLSSVCSVALDLTRPRGVRLFAIRSGSEGSRVGVSTGSHSQTPATGASTPAKNEGTASEHRSPSPADSNQQVANSTSAPEATTVAPARTTDAPNATETRRPETRTPETNAQPAPASAPHGKTARYTMNRVGKGVVHRRPAKVNAATKMGAAAAHPNAPQQGVPGSAFGSSAQGQMRTTADVGTNTATHTVPQALAAPTAQFKFTPAEPQQAAPNGAAPPPMARARPAVGPVGTRVLVNRAGPTRIAGSRVARRPTPYPGAPGSAQGGPMRFRSANRLAARPMAPATVANFGLGQPGQFVPQFPIEELVHRLQQAAQPLQPVPTAQPLQPAQTAPHQAHPENHIYENVAFAPNSRPQQTPQGPASRPLPPLPPMASPRSTTAQTTPEAQQARAVGPPKPFRNPRPASPAGVTPSLGDPPSYQESQQHQPEQPEQTTLPGQPDHQTQQTLPAQTSTPTPTPTRTQTQTPTPEAVAPPKQKRGRLMKIYNKLKGKKVPRAV